MQIERRLVLTTYVINGGYNIETIMVRDPDLMIKKGMWIQFKDDLGDTVTREVTRDPTRWDVTEVNIRLDSPATVGYDDEIKVYEAEQSSEPAIQDEKPVPVNVPATVAAESPAPVLSNSEAIVISQPKPGLTLHFSDTTLERIAECFLAGKSVDLSVVVENATPQCR